MKNIFGNSISVTLFGESHGEMIGAVLDGIAPGIKINKEHIDAMLTLRRPVGDISTPRCEKDEYRIVSGVYNGYTTGTPLTLLIPNLDTRSGDYDKHKALPRPSHADYTAECKYHGYQDGRGGGHFSGRITAALVAVGAILSSALADKGIYIGTHISSLGGIKDRGFDKLESDIALLSKKRFPVIDGEAAGNMMKYIRECGESGDSVGGILETAVIGMPAGVGEPWFDSVESELSHILFSVPAVKGVEFGAGFAFADMKGSEANDPFSVSGGRVITKTNHNGGINGGITNGMPIIFRTAIKPTPSISKEQTTVDLSTMTESTVTVGGRHDPAIIHRARAVIDAVTAIAIADMLAVRYGTDWLSGGSAL